MPGSKPEAKLDSRSQAVPAVALPASGSDQWTSLLEEVHLALARLRADELEELAARAECLLAATLGGGGARQPIPKPSRDELMQVSHQQRALGDLLRATQSNLAVLSRNHTQREQCTPFAEVNSRWVR